ncbi:mevalonate kinase family protein [Streptomyces laurentii]|uniref:mevalonate kinase family protein n=1 Tax=Streptomyces laurentii TaxID=39478 RepID=UPI00368433B7
MSTAPDPKDRSATSTRSAPGKVILLGEHAVGHGQPAIAVPITRRLSLTAALHPNEPGPPLADPAAQSAVATAARLFSLNPRQMTVRTTSDIPPGCGLGSSAALSVTLVRTLADLTHRRLEQTELLDRARAVEAAFHGTSSGLDVAVSALARPIWFRPAYPAHATPLPIAKPFDLVVAITPEQRSTADQVHQLRRRAEAAPTAYTRCFGGAIIALASDNAPGIAEALRSAGHEVSISSVD